MRRYNCRRFLAALLSLCVFFSLFAVPGVYASEDITADTGAEDEYIEDSGTEEEVTTPESAENVAGEEDPAAENSDSEGENAEQPTVDAEDNDGVSGEDTALDADGDLVEENTDETSDACGEIEENSLIFRISELENVIQVAEEAVKLSSNSESVDFSVGIYKDADRTDLDVALTSEGTELTGWTYLSESVSAEDRYLGISLGNLDENTQYQLVITMEPILYLNSISKLDGTEVSYTQNAPITVNTDGQYIPNEYSLSNLTYQINSDASNLKTGFSFGLSLAFDINLWNKLDGGNLGNGTNPLLSVYLQKQQEDGTFITIENCDVKLDQATVAGSIPYSTRIRHYLVGGSETVSVTSMGSDDTLRTEVLHFDSNVYDGANYAETVEIEIKIPTCTIDGTTYTALHRNFGFITSVGSPKFTSVFDETTGTLTISAEKMYFNSEKLFEICFSAPEALKDVEGVHEFAGSVTVWENGHAIDEPRGITFKLDNQETAKITRGGSDGLADTLYPEAVHYLGNLTMQNKSPNVSSGPLLIDLQFDSNNTNAVRVTTVNLMADSVTETFTVRYTLIDQEGDPVEINGEKEFVATVNNKEENLTATDKNNLYVQFTVPEEHSGCFLKTVSYSIGDLPASTKAYNASGIRNVKSAGTIWGYVVVDTIPTTMPTHIMNVYKIDEDGGAGVQVLGPIEIETTIDSGTKVSYGLSSAKVGNGKTENIEVEAGNSVKVSGEVIVFNYPYVSNGCLDDIRVGIILPKGITLNAASISAKYNRKNVALNVETVSTREIDDNQVLYIISFEKGNPIGYYTETLSYLEYGERISFSFQLNSDKTISEQKLILKNCLFAAGLGIENGAQSGKAEYAGVDTYDLNGNGSTVDNIGRLPDKNTASVTFKAAPAELAITDKLVNADGESGSELTMESFADILTYNLHVECTAGGSASDFYYMIPIAKESMTSDSVFVKKCQVGLQLKDAVTVTTSQGTAMKVLYSTTPITGYTNTLSLDDWSETLPEGKTWSDVTVIKVLASEDKIENGSINVISVPLGYAGADTEYKHMAGYQIQWSSRGYYHYEVGYNSNSGTKSTEGCTITLTYTPHDPIQFTLTAAKDGTPTGENAVSSYSFELPEFILAQEYSVKQIVPYNVTLVDADYDFESATSAEANDHFRIKLSVKKSNADTGSDPIALQKENDIIGSLGANSAPVFTFSIENADALSDIVTDRKVTLTLIGDNGVIVPVEIIIKRELAAADPTTSAIVAGELYAPFEGDTFTRVSCDSAFTAQFVTKYIPANYTGHAIVFDAALVSGTTITMIDWTYPTELEFYHYTMDGSTATVKLTDFQGMGSSGAFTESSETAEVMERLLFIVSFPDDGESIRDNTMKLTKNLKTDTTTEESSVLKFTTVAKRAFSLTSSASSVMRGNDFTISYTSGCSVTDSRYTNRNLSLVIEPSGSNFPVDSRLVVDDTSYYLNAQGNFLIPLKAVQTGDGSVTMSYYSQTAEAVSMQIALWTSGTANGSKPLMGDKVAGAVNVSVTADTTPSFKVAGMDDRLLSLDELSKAIKVSFKKTNVKTLTVELQQKVGADYVTQTTILESVNGTTSADAGQGVFSVKSKSSATIKLSGTTPAGTYRLLFTASNEDVIVEVPYNFLVIPN